MLTQSALFHMFIYTLISDAGYLLCKQKTAQNYKRLLSSYLISNWVIDVFDFFQSAVSHVVVKTVKVNKYRGSVQERICCLIFQQEHP